VRLGADLALIRRIVGDDPVALDLLDRALQNPVGNPTFGSHGADAIHCNIRNSDEAPSGTTSDYALRRLRKDRPDIGAKL
jgi:hypothetical protein